MPRAALVVCVVLLAAACSSDAPTGAPNYEGVVVSVGGTNVEIRHDADACGQIVFEAMDGVAVRRGDDEIGWADLRAGDRIQVWAPGVDESCPAYGGAERIEITGP